MEEDPTMEPLRNLNPYKPEDAQGATPFFLIPVVFERLWRKVNVTSVFKQGHNKPWVYRLVNLTLLPGKTAEQIL